jgi:hypothetical protein
MGRRLLTPPVLVCAAFIAVGCGAHAADPATGSSTFQQTQESATTAPPTARHTTVTKPWYRRGMHGPAFESPTGNIRCGVDRSDPMQLLCKTLNNGRGVDLDILTSSVPSSVTFTSQPPVLSYGRFWSSRNFVCWSRTDGVYCRSLYSRHGFLINRDAISQRVWPRSLIRPADGSSGGGSPGSGLTTGDEPDQQAACDPNYSGQCLDPNALDYDCGGGSGDGPGYVYGTVQITGYDHYGLDGDGDGYGCD